MSGSFCVPCSQEANFQQTAKWFCNDCQEHLCESCSQVHLQGHDLTDVAMATQSIYGYQAITCQQHIGQTISVYCVDHDIVACMVCIQACHSTCNTDEIANQAVGIYESEKLKAFITKMDTLRESCEDGLQKSKAHIQDIKTNQAQALGHMRTLRNKFDQLETKTEAAIETVVKDNLQKSSIASDTYSVLQDQICQKQTEYHLERESSNVENMFILLKQAKPTVDKVETDLEKLKQSEQLKKYVFRANEQLNDFLSTLTTLGELAELSELGNKATDVNVKSAANITDCKTTAIQILPTCQLLVADSSQNMSIKMIDKNQGTVVAEIKLSSSPWDFVLVSATEVAATLNNANKIDFIAVSPTALTLSREMPVNGQCHGIAYNNQDQTLIVSFEGPAKVEILNMTGMVIRSIINDNNGSPLFVNPLYLAMNPGKTTIYVSDHKKNTVTLLALDGQVKGVYSNKDLKQPTSILVNQDGMVSVAGYKSNNIQQITADANFVRLQLEKCHGISCPLGICYDDKEDKMYIGTTGNSIKVFQKK